MSKHQKTLAERQAELKQEVAATQKIVKAEEYAVRAASTKESNEELKSKKEVTPAALDWNVQAIMLEAQGVTVTKIAQICGKNPATVSRFIRSDKAIKIRKNLIGAESVDDLKKSFQELGSMSVQAVRELLEYKGENLIVQKAQKALEVLTMLGLKEADKKEVTHTHIEKTLIKAIEDNADEMEKERVGHA